MQVDSRNGYHAQLSGDSEGLIGSGADSCRIEENQTFDGMVNPALQRTWSAATRSVLSLFVSAVRFVELGRQAAIFSKNCGIIRVGAAMQQGDRTMPSMLKELHELEFDYADGEGMDFEPYTEFLTEEETRSWICAWTGNASLTGTEYRVFGQDGTGGLAAFWCVRPNATVLEQPVVFFGSEGELGLLARSFADYIWLLAGGLGPFEALAYPDANRAPQPEFSKFAAIHAGANRSTPSKILSDASTEFPNFVGSVLSLCR